ncbi:MAG: flagellar filament capping protein FliD [Spirochaetes bacterium]|nr:flagellar filament capping protein FliD [Spirochaetota bacterium]
MPAPQMPGLASGIDTKDIVRKLVEVERAPIVRLETGKKDLSDTSKALTELRKRTKTLQDALHAMASFEAAFEQKRLNATPAGIVDGTVKKNAPPSRHTLNILKLASNLSIATQPIPTRQKLPTAKIKIAGVESTFNGGTLQSLKEHLQKYHAKHVSTKLVQVKENESIMIVDSLAQGEDALMKIEDPDGLLRSLGLVSAAATPDFISPNKTPAKDEKKDDSAPNKPNEPPETTETERWLVNSAQLETIAGKPAQLSEDKKILSVTDGGEGRYRLLPGQNSEARRLTSISLAALAPADNADNDDAPDSLSDGVRDNINIKGIELETYNITRTRRKDIAKDSDFGVVLKYASGEKKISLKDKSGQQQIAVEKNLQAIDFFATGGDVLFETGEFSYKVKGQPKIEPAKEQASTTPAEDEQRKIFPHLLRAAQNAELKIDGIPVSRKSNNNLGDIIEGVSLNLLKTSPDNVQTEILNDNDAAKKQVVNFVKAYNELLQFADDVGKAAKVKEAGKYREMRKESGILATNNTIRQLVNGLRIHTSNAYPALREPHFRTLMQIGISSGAIGAKREDVVKGYLEVDESKLAQALSEHPAAVKELFSSDTNGDLRIDNGYAHVTENFLEPFTRYTRGLISEQIKSNAERVKQIDRDIKRQEEHVKSYEAKLKTKFGYMESSVQKNKSTGNFLRQKLGQGESR